MQLKLLVLLLSLSFAAKENENGAETILVKIEEDECPKASKKETSSQFIGVAYAFNISKWRANRHSKHEKKTVYNGHYDIEETAARASDTLARKLMKNGEKSHKLNFPDDYAEVFPEKKETSSQYFGVSYDIKLSKWHANRRSKLGKKMVHNGHYDNEETAARASDTLAKQLMANGEKDHKLNFPDDYTEVFQEKKQTSSQYVGVFYDIKLSKWRANRYSKNEKRKICYECYDNEVTAAHASDTLARMENGEKLHKLNFPDDYTEVFPEKNKLPHSSSG